MKRIITLIAVSLLTLGFVKQASAWTYTVVGTGVCNEHTGQYDLTWTVNNSEDQELSIQASNRASVPVGSEVLANNSQDFTESVAGTETSAKLTVKVNWPSDKKKRERVATITLNGDCKLPTLPPVPTPPPTPQSIEQGGVQNELPLSSTTPATVDETPEAVVPQFGK